MSKHIWGHKQISQIWLALTMRTKSTSSMVLIFAISIIKEPDLHYPEPFSWGCQCRESGPYFRCACPMWRGGVVSAYQGADKPQLLTKCTGFSQTQLFPFVIWSINTTHTGVYVPAGKGILYPSNLPSNRNALSWLILWLLLALGMCSQYLISLSCLLFAAYIPGNGLEKKMLCCSLPPGLHMWLLCSRNSGLSLSFSQQVAPELFGTDPSPITLPKNRWILHCKTFNKSIWKRHRLFCVTAWSNPAKFWIAVLLWQTALAPYLPLKSSRLLLFNSLKFYQ